ALSSRDEALGLSIERLRGERDETLRRKPLEHLEQQLAEGRSRRRILLLRDLDRQQTPQSLRVRSPFDRYAVPLAQPLSDQRIVGEGIEVPWVGHTRPPAPLMLQDLPPQRNFAHDHHAGQLADALGRRADPS